MRIKLSNHAQKRCVRRKIKKEWIEEALQHYVRLINDVDDCNLVHVYWPVPEKGYRVLRVIYNDAVEPVTIVTAFFENEVLKQ